jgi:gamma-glutamyltranspeptidase/glutathione hydrolase
MSRVITGSAIAVLLFFAPVAAQKYATSGAGMVAAPTREAAEAGVSVLRRGGNAVDAAAASALALMVTDPAMCSLGGRSQILIYLRGGKFVGIDGATQSPGAAVPAARLGHGYGTVPIPGSPAALEQMVESYGTLPWKTLMQPAIRLAKEGFLINREYHQAFRRYGENFRLYRGTAKNFLKSDGSYYSEGELLLQPALARTLEAIAEKGSSVLYRGDLAASIVRDMEKNRGWVRPEDLEQYRPQPGEIVRGTYRGYSIVSRGGQCDGASVIQMLHILEHFDLSQLHGDRSKYLHLMAQVLYLGNGDEHLPDSQQVSRAHAARRIGEIDFTRRLPNPSRPPDEGREGETNHLSVVDSSGNAVSITQSIGPSFGSKSAHPDLGFFYAYSYDMNDDPVPRQREKTSQSPTMVMRGGHPFLVLGSAGSSRIPGSIVQTIVNVIDHGMNLREALAAPRCFPNGRELRLESIGTTAEVVSNFERLGFQVRRYSSLDGYFGRVHAILFDGETRMLHGAADPRDSGAAIGNRP